MPNNEKAKVLDKKITDYLLNDSHEIGKHKANFFKRFGFDISNLGIFKNSLLQHSIEREIEKINNSEFGNKYELKCEMKTPDERNPCIVTVWIIENGKERPTLITAYPLES
jgi:hypothetical protein